MGDITVTFETEEHTIDEALFTRLKAEAYDRLKKTPNGLASAIEDMDFETFRRMLSTGLPPKTGQADELAFAGAVGFNIEGGIQGVVFQTFKLKLGGTPDPNKCIDALTHMILRFGAVDIEGETTPLNEGLWDTNKVEDLCLKTAKALQGSLSGQEQGY